MYIFKPGTDGVAFIFSHVCKVFFNHEKFYDIHGPKGIQIWRSYSLDLSFQIIYVFKVPMRFS